MKTYRPGPVESAELRRELSSIQQAAGRADSFMELEVLHVEPVKVRKGMVVIADGTDWDPGSGEGMYRRNAANDAWVFVG